MSEVDIKAQAILREWKRLDHIRKFSRGRNCEGTSFYEARREASGYAGHRVFNGGLGSWCGGWQDKRLHDSTVVSSLRTSLNGFMSYLISPTQRWFVLKAGGEVKNGFKADNIYGLNDYFETCQQEILKLYNNTNFYPTMRTFIADGMVQGTAALLIHEHEKLNELDAPLCFRTLDPADFCIDEDEDGKVDTLYRQFDLSLTAAYKRYGQDLPENLIKIYKQGGDDFKQIRFIEAIFKKGSVLDKDGREIDSDLEASKEMKFSYFLVCEENQKVIRKGSYKDFPFAVQRWERVSEDTPYGVGLVMRLLPEIKALDKNMKLQLVANEKLVNPPITVPMMMRDFDSRPGAVNFGDVSQAPVPLQTVRNYDGFAQENERLRQVIQEGMYCNLFATIMRTPNQYMTATTVQELKSEALSLMSATLNNLQEEVIIPVIKRTYKIMKEKELLPPLPSEYVKFFGEEIHIELEGVLVSRMKTYLQTQGIQSGLQFVTQVMQSTGNQDLGLNIDFDEAIRQGATSQGLPQSIIREKQEVEKQKQQLQEQRAQQAQAQQLESMTRSIANVGNAGINPREVMNANS